MVGAPRGSPQVDFARGVFHLVDESRGRDTVKSPETSGIARYRIKGFSRAEWEQTCERRMERSKKTCASFVYVRAKFRGNALDATPQKIQRPIIDGRSGQKIHSAAHVVEGRGHGFRPAQRKLALLGAQCAPRRESA